MFLCVGEGVGDKLSCKVSNPSSYLFVVADKTIMTHDISGVAIWAC